MTIEKALGLLEVGVPILIAWAASVSGLLWLVAHRLSTAISRLEGTDERLLEILIELRAARLADGDAGNGPATADAREASSPRVDERDPNGHPRPSGGP